MRRAAAAVLVAALLLSAAALGAEETDGASIVAEAAAVGAEAAGPSDPVVLFTALDLSFEYRYRSAEILVEDAAVKNGIDFTRNVLDLPPAALLNWEIGRRRGFGIGVGAELRRQFDPAYDGLFPATNVLPLGRDGNPVATENPMFTRGVIFWRGESLDLTLGRDKVDLGEGLKGSLYPSPRLPYLDAFKAKGRLGPLGMDWLVATMRAAPSWDGASIDPNEGVDTSDFPAGEAFPYGFMNSENPTIVIEALHRFTWDFERLRLGVAGHVMYARRNNYFTVTDFLPVIGWHQTKIYSNNLSTFIDAQWKPFPGLTLSGMAGLDEFNASALGVTDSGSPAVSAWVLGGEYRGRASGGALDAYAEAGYTHYLWGNFDGSNNAPGDKVTLARALYYYHQDEGAAMLPLTSPYGPGATWGRLLGGWEIPGTGLRVGLDLLLLSKIKAANLVETEVMTADPAGDPDAPRLLFFQAAFPLRWRLADFELYASPAALVRDGTWWAEATIGGTYRLRRQTAVEAPRR